MRLIYTVFTKNYLAQARTLAQSLRISNPTVPFVAILLDDPKGYFDPHSEPFEVLQGTFIIQEKLTQKQLFKLNALELCCAVKPLFGTYLFKTRQVRELLYLDSDMVVLGELSRIFADLDKSPIMLFPQALKARPNSSRDLIEERVFLGNGVFNAGMFLVSPTPEGHDFLRWWLERNLFDCPSLSQSGNFLDQKWLNLAPIFYQSLHICRSTQCNLARWNLFERRIEHIDNVYICNGEPLISWHMSGLSNNARRLQHYVSCALAESSDVVRIFCKQYLSDLNANGLEQCRVWPYSFDFFDSGKRISAIIRKLIITFDRHMADDYKIYSSGTFKIIYLLVKNTLFRIGKKLRVKLTFYRRSIGF